MLTSFVLLGSSGLPRNLEMTKNFEPPKMMRLRKKIERWKKSVPQDYLESPKHLERQESYSKPPEKDLKLQTSFALPKGLSSEPLMD